MNCSYLSTKCEHVNILIPLVFTHKVQKNLNNIILVFSSKNVCYKTRHFWPHDNNKKIVLLNIYIYTLYRCFAVHE